MNSDQDICGDDQQRDDPPIRATFVRPTQLPGETREQAIRRTADLMYEQLTGKSAAEYYRRKARRQTGQQGDE